MKYQPVPYQRELLSQEEVAKRAAEFYAFMDTRRTVREFSPTDIPDDVIDNLIMTASSAPSGAHKQPWSFCVVRDPELKKRIRVAAEKEEFESYNSRMPQEWLDDLATLGTDWKKPFLETAPALIVVFKRSYEMIAERKKNNYYVSESVGIASGFLLAAIHHAGLVGLTHTPSPMNFLAQIQERPSNEKPFLLIPIGYPNEVSMVPKLTRKPLNEVITYY
ncbi:MAG TPA: nitroreductase family protein [Bacteroidia bacterium]|nr:nitroreductase family protein [Bacteroidia bacterium]